MKTAYPLFNYTRKLARFAFNATASAAVFVASVVSLTSVAHAQPGSQPAHLRFLFLDETGGAYSLKTGGKFQQISSTPYAISPSFTPTNGEPLEIYKTSPTPDPVTGKKERIKVANVTPPANTPSALIVITPDSSTPPNYRSTVFDTNPTATPAKSLRILNLGQASLAAQFGESQIVVPAGTTQVIQPSTDASNRTFGRIAVQTNDGWKLLYNKLLIIGPEDRLTGVFVYSSTGLRYSYTAAEIAEFGAPKPGHFWLTFSEAP